MRFTRMLSGSATSLLLMFIALSPACDGDDDDTPARPNNLECSGKGGPVMDGNADAHCIDGGGEPITVALGKCVVGQLEGNSGGAGGEPGHHEGGQGGHHDDGHEEEEEHAVHSSNSGADDDCKYDVSFTNTCVEVNRPVTFTLTLKERAGGDPATGAKPSNPEVFLEADPSHISPSINIKAPEDPPGTYAVGPIVFDRSGRWVIRFHYFETCNDLPEDSPHGHIAFYIDVP